MKFISHRGNLNGPIEEYENHPEYILEALKKGFNVEIDDEIFLVIKQQDVVIVL